MEEADEILDLFDAREQVVQTVSRAEYYAKPEKYPGYLRAAGMFIMNNKGELWIPRRTAERSIAPGALDYSCDGHVISGEDYITGCLREAEEELNLRLQPHDLHLVGAFRPTRAVPYFRMLFLYKSDAVPDYNPEDFMEYFWWKPQELLRRLEHGERAKTSMASTLRRSMASLMAHSM